MNKRPSRHDQRAARTGHAGSAASIKILGRQVLHRALFQDPGREDGGRHATDQADEMSVVNVQVDGRASRFRRVGNLRGPIRPGNHPLEMSAEQLAEAPAANHVRRVSEFGEERQHVRHHQQFAGLGRRVNHGVGVPRFQGNALFHQHMLPRIERLERGGGMQMCRVADIDKVDVRIGQQFFQPIVFLDRSQIHHLARRSEVASDGPPVSC